MQISSRFTIGTHVLIMIALQGEKTKVTSDFLAGSVGVNPVIIRKTLSQLKKAGLIHVARGTGGAELAKAADEISLLDIYQAVECLGSTGQLFGFHEKPESNLPNRSQYPPCLRWEARRHSDCYGKRDGSNHLKDVVEDTQKRMDLESVS